MRTFVRRSRIDAPAEDLFAWHERPGAFERLTPPWERVRVVERSGGIRDGDRVVLEVPAGPFRARWSIQHRGYESGRSFEDVQTSGPFRHWRHVHRFIPDGPGASFLEDEIEYALPLGMLSEPLAGSIVEGRLARLFAYRHRTTRDDLAAHRASRGERPLRILVSGSTGLIGSTLVPFLTAGGHQVIRFSRARAIDEESLEGLDAVVHLAAESIGAGPWNATKKKRILESRARGTRLLCEALARRACRPKVFVSSSAIGFYGDRGAAVVDEDSPPGRGFLADVCREWEAATAPTEDAGIRVVRLRTAIVLSPVGGALAKMLIPFSLGAGGRLGSGRQIMSWIAIDDLVSLILHAIAHDSLSGALNAATPNPVTNLEFVRTLGRVMRRPAALPIPAWGLRLLFGEMARETILSSARVAPLRAIQSGYAFRHPDLEGALRHLFGRMIAS